MTDLKLKLEEKIDYCDTVSMMTFRLKVENVKLWENEISKTLRMAKFDREVEKLKKPLFQYLENENEPKLTPGKKAKIIREKTQNFCIDKPEWLTLDEWDKNPLNYDSCKLFKPKESLKDMCDSSWLWYVHYIRDNKDMVGIYKGEEKDVRDFIISSKIVKMVKIFCLEIPKNFKARNTDKYPTTYKNAKVSIDSNSKTKYDILKSVGICEQRITLDIPDKE